MISRVRSKCLAAAKLVDDAVDLSLDVVDYGSLAAAKNMKKFRLEHAGDISQAVKRQADDEDRERAKAAVGTNAVRRAQRPWSEFFERFLWPENRDCWAERVLTNLNYYHVSLTTAATHI
jgi:hypothetical protein